MKLIKLIPLFILVFTLSACTVEGEQGIQGEQGEQGVQGEPGTDGAVGMQGIQGIQGIQGEPGVDGVQGEDGLSAYQVWLTIPGNEGKTETEFIAALVGTVDISIVEQLQAEINTLKLFSDILELNIWLDQLPETFTSGDDFPYQDLPTLLHASVVTGVMHTFDFYSDNGDLTITITYGTISEDIDLSYSVVMNQTEIDAMHLQQATEDAAELQTWLDAMPSTVMHGDAFPSYPVVTNGSYIFGASGLVFNYFAQNGEVILTVNKNGQTATASKTFVINQMFQQLANQDAQYLQNWLNSLNGTFGDGDYLPTPPPLPNGSVITSGYPFEFSYPSDTVVIEIENGFATATASREFSVLPF